MKLSKNIIWLLFFIFSISATLQLFAMDKEKYESLQKGGDLTEFDFRTHITGKVWNTISNYGRYGEPDAPDNGLPSMEWPGGSGKCYLWHGGMWVGTVIDGEVRVSSADYGAYEYGPTEGTEFQFPPSSQISMEDGLVTFDDVTDRHSTNRIGIKIEERSLTWATPGYNDFIAYQYTLTNISGRELNDVFIGWAYDCDVGCVADPDEPHIDDLVDYDGYNPDNDSYKLDIVDNIDYDGDGVINGYDEWGIPYAWRGGYVGSPENIYENYDEEQESPDGFYDCYTVYLDENGPEITWQINFSGGNAGEVAVVNGQTLHGWVFSRNASFMYDGDNNGTPMEDTGDRTESFGPIDGFIGGVLIYSDVPAFEDNEDDMFRRPFAHQWWNWETDPGSDVEAYNYLTANHSSAPGVHVKPHPFDVQAPTFDYRWLTSNGPYNGWTDGEKRRIIYAAVMGKGLEGLRKNIDNLYHAYYSGSTHSNPANPSDFDSDVHWAIPVAPAVPNLVYSPINNGVKLLWSTEVENMLDPVLGINDFRGYKVYRSLYTPSEWQMIAAYDNVDEPVAVVDLNGDTLSRSVNLPELTSSFTDVGGTFLDSIISTPLNGIPYYYAVAAYDTDKPERGLYSLESPLTNFKVDMETGAPSPVEPKLYYEDEDQTKFDMEKIVVAPNPYRGASIYELEYQDKIFFFNIPPACKISIFTVSGDLVREMYHEDGSGQEAWDLLSNANNIGVRTGLYIYVIETEKQTHHGKFVILK